MSDGGLKNALSLLIHCGKDSTMSMSDKVRCDECGSSYGISDWPWCKGTGDHTPGKFGHKPFCPYTDEHLLPPDTPMSQHHGLNLAGDPCIGTYIESREQRKAIMKAHGIVPKGRRYGGPTTPEF